MQLFYQQNSNRFYINVNISNITVYSMFSSFDGAKIECDYATEKYFFNRIQNNNRKCAFFPLFIEIKKYQKKMCD